MKQKEFARADYEGLSKEGQKYLRAKRNYFAQDFINDRRRGSNLIPDFDHFRGLFRKDAESIDRDLKSGNNNLIEGAKRKIRLAIFDDHILKRSNNKEMLAKKEARRANKSFIDPLLKNKETRAERAKQLAAERASKASQVQQQTQKAAESTVKQGVEKVAPANSKRLKLVEELRAKKALGQKLKKAGMIGAGVAGTAGLVYGGKKLYDKYKNKDMKEQKEFTRADYKGLNFIEKFGKKLKRNKIANELNKRRNQINKELEDNLTYYNDGSAEKLANFKRGRALNRAKYAEYKDLDISGSTFETPKVSKEKASKLRDMFNRAKENIKNSKAGKNAADFYAKHEKGVKIGGVAAGTALAAGLAVGAKKLADKKKEQQKEFARADYEGLNFIETFKKNYKRNRVAQELKKQRNQINKELEENLKYNASRAKKIANLKRTKALDSIRLGETMENLANLAGSPAEAFKKKPMSNLKKAGYAGLGVAGAAGLAYGGKKLYDKYKKNKESNNKD
jgi:hypothetical protein